MMHFTIPVHVECYEPNGSTYVGYKINVNGEYHCTVRYKQLFNLNEQLKKVHGYDIVPHFPPKKYWPMTMGQLEERRSLLEKYLQEIGQSHALMNSDLFKTFLINAQQESFNEKVKEVTLDVYKMNGYSIHITMSSDESTDVLLKKVCNQINLPEEYIYYFSLFLIRKEEGAYITIIRKLQDFESPYISQKTIEGDNKIMLRKSYWDPDYDLELMIDRVSLDLLYIQTISDLERGWILCSKEMRSRLATLQATGAKREFLELSKTLKYYGYVQFKECNCDYPVPDTKVTVSIGQRELNIRIPLPNGNVREYLFKVTRMRGWRITSGTNIQENGEINSQDSSNNLLELSFEYLLAKDKLQWITIHSQQAILMSVCLQSMVDELLLQRIGCKIKQVPKEYHYTTFNYIKRDGSSQVITISQSSSTDTLSGGTSDSTKSPSRNEPIMSMRRLSEKLSGLKTNQNNQSLFENDAFEGIGDDDL